VNGTVVYRSTAPTNTQDRQEIALGVLVHIANPLLLTTINNEQSQAAYDGNGLRDLMNAIGFMNLTGNLLSSNSLLTITKSIGTMFAHGSNYSNDTLDPHTLSLPLIDTNAGGTFQYRMQDGTSSALTLTDKIPNILDTGAYPGTTYATNQWGVHRVYSFTSNALKIQPAQSTEGTVDAAISAITDGTFITEPSILANGLLIGYIVTKGNCSDLSDLNECRFLAAGKFGASQSQVNSSGNVSSAASTTDAIARYSDLTGNLINSSVVTISDTGLISGVLDPVSAQDAVTKSYIDNSRAIYENVITPIMASSSQDGFEISASSQFSVSFPAWKSFNNDPFEGQTSGSADDGWSTIGNSYNITTGVALFSRTKFDATINQEWIQAKFPNSQQVSGFKIKARGSQLELVPVDFKIYGSLTGLEDGGWDLLNTITGHTFTDVWEGKEWSISGTYQYIGMSITKIPANAFGAGNVGEIFIKRTATKLQLDGLLPMTGDLTCVGLTTTGAVSLNTSSLQINGSTVQIQNSGICQIQPTGALTVKEFNEYASGSLPTASTNEGKIVYITNEKRIGFSDGITWNRLKIDSPIAKSINGLVAWYDASDSLSVSQSAGNVAVWNDLSGSGFNLSTVVGTPRTGDTTQNGLNVVDFLKADQEGIGNTGSLINYDTHTIVLVLTLSAVGTLGLFGTGGASDGHVSMYKNPAGTATNTSYRGATSNSNTSPFIVSDTFSIFIQRVTATTMDFIEDGVTNYDSSPMSGTHGGTSTGVILGNDDLSSGDGMTGSVGECIIYNTDLTNAELNALGNSLAQKWNVPWADLP
jgi:hypothetical protein